MLLELFCLIRALFQRPLAKAFDHRTTQISHSYEIYGDRLYPIRTVFIIICHENYRQETKNYRFPIEYKIHLLGFRKGSLI